MINLIVLLVTLMLVYKILTLVELMVTLKSLKPGRDNTITVRKINHLRGML